MSRLNEQTRVSLLHLAHEIVNNRSINHGTVVTTEKVIEEAEKLERFVSQRQKKKKKKKVEAKAKFLTETTKE